MSHRIECQCHLCCRQRKHPVPDEKHVHDRHVQTVVMPENGGMVTATWQPSQLRWILTVETDNGEATVLLSIDEANAIRTTLETSL